MAARSKKATKVRAASEFDLRALIQRLSTQRVSNGAWSWTLAEIQAARDAQMRGDFRQSARLADAFATDSAMFVARRNRLAPQRSIPVKMIAANESARATRWCAEMDALYGPNGVGVTPETMVTINKHLADHGVGIGVNTANVRDNGSRIDLEHHCWPIGEVRVDATRRNASGGWGCYVTRVDPDAINEAGLPLEKATDGAWQMPAISSMTGALPTSATGEVEIVPNDGRWTVYAGEELEPWKNGCVLPGALVWASHAFGFRDMNKTSRAHGNVRVMGMLPEGMAIDSAEGAAYLDAITLLVEGSAPAGIQPFGAKTEFMANGSSMWQIFKELILMARSDASQIYNGHDGLLGTNAAGPGVDLETLTRISNGIAEGDLHTIERCFGTGVVEVCTALNTGDSTLAPLRQYQIPDPDQAARRAESATSRESFYKAIERERELGFDVSSARIKALAEDHGVSSAELIEVTTEKPSIVLAPTDIARVVSVNEARASAGLGPRVLPGGALDPDGELTVEELSAKLAAKAAAPAPSLNGSSNGAPKQLPKIAEA